MALPRTGQHGPVLPEAKAMRVGMALRRGIPCHWCALQWHEEEWGNPVVLGRRSAAGRTARSWASPGRKKLPQGLARLWCDTLCGAEVSTAASPIRQDQWASALGHAVDSELKLLAIRVTANSPRLRTASPSPRAVRDLT